MKLDPNSKLDPFITVSAEPEPQRFVSWTAAERAAKQKPPMTADASDCDLAAEAMAQPEFDEVFAALNLLEEPEYMAGRLIDIMGTYSLRKHAFVNPDGSVVPLQRLRDAVEARIDDLGLDRALIEAYMAPQYRSVATEQAWRQQDFATRMQTFRKQGVTQ